MRRALPILLLLSCLGSALAFRSRSIWLPRVHVLSKWHEASPGILVARMSWPDGNGGKVHITAIRTTASRVHIATGQTLDAAQWRRSTNAICAINGGFFDDDGRSLGLRLSKGKQRSPLHNADWGVFFVRGKRALIVHTRDYAVATRDSVGAAYEAVQCGPRLVVAGRVTRLKPQSARRTGIGIDKQGRVVLAVADGKLPFDRWAALWAAPDGLACRDALNLDGGPSTQMSLEAAGTTASVEGGWPVPDAVVVR